MEGIVGDSAKSIQSIVDRDTNFARKYGYAGGLRWNAISAVEIFEPVLAYWEKRVDTDKSTLERLLDTGVLLELMNLFVHMNRDEFYSTHVSVKCKSCLGKLCTVKRDLYNAVVIKCRFVSLVCKFSVNIQFIKQLARLTGQDVKHSCLRLLRQIISNEVAVLFNWHGVKNKENFSKLNLCQVILSVIRNAHTSVKDEQISKPIKIWLAHAKERIERQRGKNTTDQVRNNDGRDAPAQLQSRRGSDDH
ncbi:PREDICTED: uncharacterized protein LOC105569134 [Vollenhovia emeryi]|uniref:uncharacterized protein LOC105569134 n=1 Tax=Vollenhovia emeryi TaxID=411798 RepID=UPI0005F49BB6|nr:PREDICTED: uncharacterized protein LOC105569134 [Vollenhovia emeryi]